MGGNGTVVGVKRVEAGMPSEEWDDSMPLPGDIVKGVAPADDDDDEESPIFASAKSRSEISSVLGRLGRRSESIWVKVQRGSSLLDLRARVVPYRGHKLYRRFTVMAARDDRHVAVLGDLTLEQCAELQEMSRTMVTADGSGFVRKKSVSYDWKKKVGTYLPDSHSTLISSILFVPFPSERNFEATTTRSMAWFSSAVSSGAPLVFVNIQTEQISSWKEMSWLKQQSPKHSSTVELLQAIRLWFLPGIAEVPLVLAPEEGERRFGMDIERTEEVLNLNSSSHEVEHLMHNRLRRASSASAPFSKAQQRIAPGSATSAVMPARQDNWSSSLDCKGKESSPPRSPPTGASCAAITRVSKKSLRLPSRRWWRFISTS
ncbi:hypothetical protein MUK42_02991 [Musa troglodytarum]|uniref:Uncharacterized protein n=1 Tax=Musa troglodytarum TaxID=320322 RepID=A0A9E7ICH9_9LILI|nr:hypothetical protein MUK42_02991 [Musa troglodytarum]